MNVKTVVRELNSDTKIKIVCWILSLKEATVSSLTEKIGNKTRVNISKQICELKQSGILKSSTIGRNNFYCFNQELRYEIMVLIKTIVNTYHLVDERKVDFIPHQ